MVCVDTLAKNTHKSPNKNTFMQKKNKIKIKIHTRALAFTDIHTHADIPVVLASLFDQWDLATQQHPGKKKKSRIKLISRVGLFFFVFSFSLYLFMCIHGRTFISFM